MDRSELLANSALNEVRALRREVQGLRDLVSKYEQRLTAMEPTPEPVERPYPHKVPGTTGRGVKHTLSDGSIFAGPRAKAVLAEAALSVPQDVANLAQ